MQRSLKRSQQSTSHAHETAYAPANQINLWPPSLHAAAWPLGHVGMTHVARVSIQNHAPTTVLYKETTQVQYTRGQVLRSNQENWKFSAKQRENSLKQYCFPKTWKPQVAESCPRPLHEGRTTNSLYGKLRNSATQINVQVQINSQMTGTSANRNGLQKPCTQMSTDPVFQDSHARTAKLISAKFQNHGPDAGKSWQKQAQVLDLVKKFSKKLKKQACLQK